MVMQSRSTSLRTALLVARVAVTLVCSTTFAALDILGGYDIQNINGFDEHLQVHHRQLNAGLCTNETLEQTYYFEVTVRLEPDNVTDVCLLADQVLVGHDINLLLLDHGIGAAGADDEAVFLAGVCPTPITTSGGGTTTTTTSNHDPAAASDGRRRSLGFRQPAYIFDGGGGCRGCFKADSDHRNLQLELVTETQQPQQQQPQLTTAENWFTDIYAPWLETKLETAIANEIVPAHARCLGQVPQEIDVTVIQINRRDLELGCENGKVIETLQSISLQDNVLRDRYCDKCVSADFSHYKSFGQAIPLVKGDYISNNLWKFEHGFSVIASGGYNPSFQARIFDTGDQACVNEENGSLEFGSPNKNCENGGLGEGDGGRPGEQGENCKPLGNVLIIQESNKTCPDSAPLGGTIKFVFDEPVLVSDIGLMDVDEVAQRIRMTYADGVSELFAYPNFGDNAVQRVICNKLNVKVLEVIFAGTGAITEINFCPLCRPLRNMHQSGTHCLTTENGATIKGVEQIAFDDFEGAWRDTAVKGWQNARWDETSTTNFTKFLGRYSTGMPSPSKVYKVPREAEQVTFELDFYEIDSWDYARKYGTDEANIYVDGEKISLGIFSVSVDEGTFSGVTTHGIIWTCESLGEPDYFGFNDAYLDQKHRVTIHVPKNTGMLRDGKLRLTLEVLLSESIDNESGGWDNIRVSVRHGCGAPTTPSTSQSYLQAPTTAAPTVTAQPTLTQPNCDDMSPQFVLFEDFEGNEPLTGWSNGRIEDLEQANFTTFLGRYGRIRWPPVKTFNIPSDTDVLFLEFDFYEIDTWDARYDPVAGYDTASVILDDAVNIDLGAFAMWEDEGSTTSITEGIVMRKNSLGPPAALGFGSSNDQKHHVVIEIPSTSINLSDGRLRVKFVTNVTNPIFDESGGWDNIKISVKVGCRYTDAENPSDAISDFPSTTVPSSLPSSPTQPAASVKQSVYNSYQQVPTTAAPSIAAGPALTQPSCDDAPSQFVSFEDFEGNEPLTGWSNGRIEDLEQANFTTFLGRYAKSKWSPAKTFQVPNNTDVLFLEFDFYEIDTWDARYDPVAGYDTASVILDYVVKIDLGAFAVWEDEGSTTSITEGIVMRKNSLGPPAALGFGSSNDQKHHVVIEIPSTSINLSDGRLRVKFETNVTGGVFDESSGWDNIKITSKIGCRYTGPDGSTNSSLTADSSSHSNLLINDVGVDEIKEAASDFPSSIPSSIPSYIPSMLPTATRV